MAQKLTVEDLHWIGEAFKKRCPDHTIQYCFVDQEGELFFSFYAPDCTNENQDKKSWWFTAHTVAEVVENLDWAESETKC